MTATLHALAAAGSAAALAELLTPETPMTTEHTPTPWELQVSASGYPEMIHGGKTENFRRIADLSNMDSEYDAKTTLANWKLMCAAPELLDALAEAVYQAEQQGECMTTKETPEWVKQARAAIKKATQV